MWTSNDENRIEVSGRMNGTSNVVALDERAIAAAMPAPSVANLNVTKSSKVHIGPKFVSVTQNVQNAETVKGRFLGLELVTSNRARKIRCCVVVFIGWALIVAIALMIYIIYVTLPQQTRLDIGKFLCLDLVTTKKARRLRCSAIVFILCALIVTTSLIIYVLYLTRPTKTRIDIGHFLGLELVSSEQSRRLRCSVAVFVCWAFIVATSLMIYIVYVTLPRQTRLDIGQFLGLNLVSSKTARRLRCSVAVFVCWALIIAIGLIVIIVYVTLPSQMRLDIELPLPRYLWNIVKNSSRTERLSCAVALLVLITCITLIIYFTLQSSEPMSPEDLPPDVWNITREMWLAQPYDAHTFIMQDFRPTMLIIIHHTVSQECTTAAQCSAELRNIQNMYLRDLKYDLPYSFVVGNDGRVYEARGWNVEGAHTFRYNLCAHAIAFTGDYRAEIPNHSSVSELQLNRTRLLLNEGVRSGILRPDYLIAGASDLADTMSPGSNLIEAFSKWKNYDHQHRFRGLNCTQMQEKFGNVTLVDL